VPGEFSARNWYCAARVVENVPFLTLVATGDPVPLRHPQARQKGLQRRFEKHDGIDRAGGSDSSKHLAPLGEE